jgi:hypothetical protein
MKKLIVFLLVSLSLDAQIMSTYFPAYESNRGKGNGKLFYRLYSLNTNLAFPTTEAEMDAFYNTYGTFKSQNIVSIATNNGTTNSTSSSTPNIINFNASTQFTSSINNTSPYTGWNGDTYGVIISGYFIPKQSGTYKFTIEGDDAVDLFINGTNIANHYGGHGASPRGTHTGTISLVAGKKYNLRVRFMENLVGDELYLFWQKPTETGGTVWYQDAEEISTDEYIPNGLVINVDPSNMYSYPRTGSTLSDLKGNVSGTIGGNVAFNTTNPGYFTFDGNGDYIDFGANPTNFPPTGDIRVFMWVRPTSLNVGWNIFMSKWFQDLSGTGGLYDFHFAFYPIGSTLYQNLYTTNRFNATGSTAVTVNNWYMVGFTINNGNLQFYLNGSLDGGVQTNSARTNQTANRFWIGDGRAGVGGFIGNIGSAAVYNRALSFDEVIQNYNATKTKYGL